MVEVPHIFDQPGAAFVLLRAGEKYPPVEKEWQRKLHTFREAADHAKNGGNVGVMAGFGYIGLDLDDPTAFTGLQLPPTCRWETRKGRYGLWFKALDITEALQTIKKKPDQAQLKLFKDGKPCGEVKLQRTYQVIPPSWKTLEDGSRADYRLLDSIPPATIELSRLLADLLAIGITFSSKLEQNTEKLENMGREARQERAETDEQRTRRYAEAALNSEVARLQSTVEGDRNSRLYRSAANLGEFVAVGVLSEDEVVASLALVADKKGLGIDEIRRTIRSGLDTGKQHPREIPDQIQRGFELTEGGNASRLEELCSDELRYCHTHGKWLIWRGGRWQIDLDGGANRLAQKVINNLYREAANADGKDERNAIAKFAKETDSRKGISNMLALAGNRLTFAITADQLDTDPWLLGGSDITFDLKAGSIRAPRREDLITKAIGARYDANAECPTWEQFLERIFGGDEELINYIKRAVGYCLTGSIAEQVFFFCYGSGANGKSVFLATLRALLGEYAKQADFSTFLVQRNEKVRNDLAALAGARVITAIEAEEGSRLSMQVIKAWTGGDPITARFLFSEHFTFQPVGEIWLAANNKPAISERNHAAWRRVQLIPFNVTIPEAEQDKNLEVKLLAELPGILNWALDGLAEYLKIGLKTPPAVRLATAKYREENDSLEAFISECCDVDKLKVCKNSDLYSQYQSFCAMSGLKALSPHKFTPELNAREGIKSTKSKHGVNWLGIALKPDWCSFDAKASPLSRDSKGDGLKENAQTFQNSALREDFAHLTPKASQRYDLEASPGHTTSQWEGEDDPERIRLTSEKRQCCLCGQEFPYNLTPYLNNGQRGYICSSCHIYGQPAEAAKEDDSQTRLELGEEAGA